MLVIRNQDIDRIVNPIEMVEAIEEAMIVYESGDFHMPDRMHVDYKENTLLLMPSFTKDYFSTKLVSVFPENKKINEPVIKGLVVLNDGKTGEPISLINAAGLTAHRTAGVSAAGIKHLAGKEVNSIGIIGAGVQGFYQAIYAASITKAENIFFHDPSKKNWKKYISDLSFYTKATVNVANSSEELIQKADIIITATGSEKPVLPDDPALLKNKMVIAIGSYKPTMKEIPDSFFELVNECFVDSESAMHESADVIDPVSNGTIKQEKVFTLGKAILKIEKPSSSTIYYKTVGMALFDLFAATYIYQKANEKNIGFNLRI